MHDSEQNLLIDQGYWSVIKAILKSFFLQYVQLLSIYSGTGANGMIDLLQNTSRS